MGGSTVGHGRARPPPPRFLEANVKALIFTIGAPPPRFITFAYRALPQILIVLPRF